MSLIESFQLSWTDTDSIEFDTLDGKWQEVNLKPTKHIGKQKTNTTPHGIKL